MHKDLEKRVQALEDTLAIQNLKHTYPVSYTHLTLPTNREV